MKKPELHKPTIEKISIMQQYASGKLIEEQLTSIGEWVPSIEPEWDWSMFNYRKAEIQDYFKPTELIHNEYDPDIEAIPTASGLRIKRKVSKPKVDESQTGQSEAQSLIDLLPKNQPDELATKLKAIDEHYDAMHQSTWNTIKSIFRR